MSQSNMTNNINKRFMATIAFTFIAFGFAILAYLGTTTDVTPVQPKKKKKVAFTLEKNTQVTARTQMEVKSGDWTRRSEDAEPDLFWHKMVVVPERTEPKPKPSNPSAGEKRKRDESMVDVVYFTNRDGSKRPRKAPRTLQELRKECEAEWSNFNQGWHSRARGQVKIAVAMIKIQVAKACSDFGQRYKYGRKPDEARAGKRRRDIDDDPMPTVKRRVLQTRETVECVASGATVCGFPHPESYWQLDGYPWAGIPKKIPTMVPSSEDLEDWLEQKLGEDDHIRGQREEREAKAMEALPKLIDIANRGTPEEVCDARQELIRSRIILFWKEAIDLDRQIKNLKPCLREARRGYAKLAGLEARLEKMLRMPAGELERRRREMKAEKHEGRLINYFVDRPKTSETFPTWWQRADSVYLSCLVLRDDLMQAELQSPDFPGEEAFSWLDDDSTQAELQPTDFLNGAASGWLGIEKWLDRTDEAWVPQGLDLLPRDAMVRAERRWKEGMRLEGKWAKTKRDWDETRANRRHLGIPTTREERKKMDEVLRAEARAARSASVPPPEWQRFNLSRADPNSMLNEPLLAEWDTLYHGDAYKLHMSGDSPGDLAVIEEEGWGHQQALTPDAKLLKQLWEEKTGNCLTHEQIYEGRSSAGL